METLSNVEQLTCKKGHSLSAPGAAGLMKSRAGRLVVYCVTCASERGRKARQMPTCRRGHPWTPENTYFIPRNDGRPTSRTCKICRDANRRDISARRRKGAPRRSNRSSEHHSSVPCGSGQSGRFEAVTELVDHARYEMERDFAARRRAQREAEIHERCQAALTRTITFREMVRYLAPKARRSA